MTTRSFQLVGLWIVALAFMASSAFGQFPGAHLTDDDHSIVDDNEDPVDELVDPVDDVLDPIASADAYYDAPWGLFEHHRGGLQIHGWINGGISWNPDDNISRFNGTVLFNDRDAEPQLNQLYTVIEKPIDPDYWEWQIGGRADILWGTDGRFATVTGLERDQNGNSELNSGRFYHLAFPQFYVEMGRGDFSLKVGHFYTIIGYEGVMATSNFFYSHAYTMAYGEPFTHTGALASWQVNDRVNVKAGIHNGWDNFTRANSSTFVGGFLGPFNTPDLYNDWGPMGSITWTSCDERTSLTIAGIHGDELDPDYVDRNMYSVVLQHQVSDRTQIVLQHDNGWQVFSGINEPVEWYGLNGYLFHTVNDRLTLGLRMEWFRDDDAARVSSIDPSVFNNLPILNQAFSGSFYEITFGANWKPCENLTIRPEFRWDWFDNANIQNGLVFGEDPTTNAAVKNTQFLFSVDAIITW